MIRMSFSCPRKAEGGPTFILEMSNFWRSRSLKTLSYLSTMSSNGTTIPILTFDKDSFCKTLVNGLPSLAFWSFFLSLEFLDSPPKKECLSCQLSASILGMGSKHNRSRFGIPDFVPFDTRSNFA